jgi:NAD(P)-dependent dehydrogenase (short-subunit alcohol dehydrogenase family)
MSDGPSRTAILTGVTGGWGRAVLDRFLDRGWNVCATTRSAGEGGLPDAVLSVECDLTDTSSADSVVTTALDRFGSVDALACVAGGFRLSGPLHESSPDDWRFMLGVNLDTAYTITRAALAPMVAAGAGSIVYVGSRAGIRPFAGAAPYIVSKAAVLALMGAVDAEVRTKGVRVNTVIPNIVDTPRNREENPDADVSRWTTGEELARVIEWLCAEDSAPLSGGAIPAYGRS